MKNTLKSWEKQFRTKFESQEKQKKLGKNTERQEKYFEKLEKIQVRPKKKGPHSNLGKKLGKILKIRKNTLENQEKY